jgi:hypothetical protein
MAEQSPFADLALYTETLQRFARLELRRVAGRHHFHLEGAAEAIAAELNRFLAAP